MVGAFAMLNRKVIAVFVGTQLLALGSGELVLLRATTRNNISFSLNNSVTVQGDQFMAIQCAFDSAEEKELARCLIRPVRRGGHVGEAPAVLPGVLNDLIGQPFDIDLASLRTELTNVGTNEASVGGALNQDVAKARFFVIHDTSSPEIKEASFPANMNEASWSGNKLTSWLNSGTPTHVFVNRVGQSATKNDFRKVVRGTKYESGRDISNPTKRAQAKEKRSGLFVHIELIQPRRRTNPNSSFFDIAPTPGFTEQQLERLALLYVIASFRSKRWLLPAFHAPVDATIPDAHDDPQNFNLDLWLNKLNLLVTRLRQ